MYGDTHVHYGIGPVESRPDDSGARRQIDVPGRDVDGFFVAEPEARVTLNVLKPFRIGFGLGYRFVGSDSRDLGLSGPTFTFSFKFGMF